MLCYDMGLCQRLHHNSCHVAVIPEVEHFKDDTIGKGTAEAGNSCNTHGQSCKSQHGGKSHGTEGRRTNHLDNPSQQKSHENGRLLCSCRNHAADVRQGCIHSRIHQEGDESGNRCNHESTQHGIQARRKVFLNKRRNEANCISCDKSRKDAVSSQSNTGNYCKYGIHSHAYRYHNCRCHAAHVARYGARFPKECQVKQISGYVPVDSLHKESCNCCIGHSRHGR